jgi:putative endonuclease
LGSDPEFPRPRISRLGSDPGFSPPQRAGFDAEDRAAIYLAERGLKIVARNFRTRLGEIDLVAQEGDVLAFVEVRMRASGTFGGALESITPHKQRRLRAAASQFLQKLGREPRCRFDVVLLEAGEVRWLRAAFD